MGQITKQAILSVGTKPKEVYIPEWGGSVMIRSLTLAEQAKLADLATKFEKATYLVRLKNVALCVVQWGTCDEQGNSLFVPEDVDAMLNQPASAFLRLQDQILKYSGLTEEARKELEKNLLNAQTDGQSFV
jgi:hypothetical protein